MTCGSDGAVPLPRSAPPTVRPGTADRQRLCSWRRSIDGSTVTSSSEQLAELAASGQAISAIRSRLGTGYLAAYWPLWGEINPAPLVNKVEPSDAAIPAGVVYPMVRGESLGWYRWADAEPPTGRVRGTPDPGPSVPSIPLRDVGVVLVPLVAFDTAGNRLGQGAGFYDRALGALPPAERPLLVGLAYDEQELDEWRPEMWDVPMDIVLTPSRVIVSQRADRDSAPN